MEAGGVVRSELTLSADGVRVWCVVCMYGWVGVYIYSICIDPYRYMYPFILTNTHTQRYTYVCIHRYVCVYMYIYIHAHPWRGGSGRDGWIREGARRERERRRRKTRSSWVADSLCVCNWLQIRTFYFILKKNEKRV